MQAALMLAMTLCSTSAVTESSAPLQRHAAAGLLHLSFLHARLLQRRPTGGCEGEDTCAQLLKGAAAVQAGHALIGALMPEYDPVAKISIVPRGAAGGLTFFSPSEERLESGLYRCGLLPPVQKATCILRWLLPVFTARGPWRGRIKPPMQHLAITRKTAGVAVTGSYDARSYDACLVFQAARR